METKRKCKDCPADISDRGSRAKRCIPCQKKYRLKREYLTPYKKEWWQKNKDRYKNVRKLKLGNPKQDEEILAFIRRKRHEKR